MPNLGFFFYPPAPGSGFGKKFRIRIHGLKISRVLTDPDPKHCLKDNPLLHVALYRNIRIFFEDMKVNWLIAMQEVLSADSSRRLPKKSVDLTASRSTSHLTHHLAPQACIVGL